MTFPTPIRSADEQLRADLKNIRKLISNLEQRPGQVVVLTPQSASYALTALKELYIQTTRQPDDDQYSVDQWDRQYIHARRLCTAAHFDSAVGAFEAAAKAMPKDRITLRQGIRMLRGSQTE